MTNQCDTAGISPHSRLRRLYLLLAPGILVAATGVGSGDLINAAIGGSKLGVAIVWAAVVGSILKWFLNEGLARWQMATGTTLLEGWTDHLGRPVRWTFLIYFIPWCFFTGGSLISACGVAGQALLPITADPATGKIIWGAIHSLAGLLLVRIGGFRLFEKFMSICIGVMFGTVLLTAGLILRDGAHLGDLFKCYFPTDPEGRKLLLGVLGGVGGTVTLLSYGYWIREQGRSGKQGVRTCRIDLAAGYVMTGLFGVAMILIGSKLRLSGTGDGVAVLLADQLSDALGSLGHVGRWTFLIGFWGAVFSSLLGVWQSAPYLFTDFHLLGGDRSARERRNLVYETSSIYRWTLYAIGFVPLVLLAWPLKKVQIAYAVLGACFMPLLALTLLILNNSRHVVPGLRNGLITNAMLTLTLGYFAYEGAMYILSVWPG